MQNRNIWYLQNIHYQTFCSPYSIHSWKWIFGPGTWPKYRIVERLCLYEMSLYDGNMQPYLRLPSWQCLTNSLLIQKGAKMCLGVERSKLNTKPLSRESSIIGMYPNGPMFLKQWRIREPINSSQKLAARTSSTGILPHGILMSLTVGSFVCLSVTCARLIVIIHPKQNTSLQARCYTWAFGVMAEYGRAGGDIHQMFKVMWGEQSCNPDALLHEWHGICDGIKDLSCETFLPEN